MQDAIVVIEDELIAGGTTTIANRLNEARVGVDIE